MKILTILIAGVLVLHGLIHLMGTVTFMKLGTVQGLEYKTSLLNGRWNLGERGIAVYGALWALAAIGFVISAIAMLAGWEWSRLALLVVAAFSLALTMLDWQDAQAGGILNIIILLAAGIGPNILKWFGH